MSLQKSLGWMGLAQAISILTQFAASVVLARLLSPREFGVFAVALAVSGVLSLIQALGLHALIVRERELDDHITATAFTINAAIAVGLSGLLALASQVGGFLLADEGVRHVLFAIALTPLFGIFAFLPSAQLERRGRFKEIAIAGTIAGVISAVTTVVFALRGASYMSFAYGQWAQALSSTVLICVFGAAFNRFTLGLNAWRRVADFGMQMLLVSGVTAVSGRLSDLILGRVLGLASLGLYSRAAGLNGLVWTNIHLVLGRVLLVDFAEIVRRGESLRARYIRTVDIITACLWPAFLGLAIIANPFVATLYGEKWLPAVVPLVILAVASMIQVAITMTWELFATTGNLRVQTRIEIVRAAFAVITFTIGCFISLEAAAFAKVLDSIFAYMLYRPHISRMTSTTSADFMPIYGKNLLLSAVAVAPSAILMIQTGFDPRTAFGWVVLSVGIGILCWGVCLWRLKHPLAVETQVIIGKMVKRGAA
jgi:O-antigen/teichoic acid export membrane protein